MPPEQLPDPVTRVFEHLNPKISVPLQGPSEMGISGELANWDRTPEPEGSPCPRWSSAPATTRWIQRT